MGHVNGRLKVIEADFVSLGAGPTNVHISPLEQGTEWEIIWAIGSQNDGAVLHGWQWVDPENPAGVLLYEITGALDIPLPLGAMDSDLPNVSMRTWWATWNRHPSYRFEASGVDKTGKIVAIVIEHLGVEGLD